MDERLIKKCIGLPVPTWDMAHRLSIDQSTGPNIQDTGTIFRINSIYMDVIEPSFLQKQWFVTGVAFAFVAIAYGPYIYWMTNIIYPYAGGTLGNIFAAFISLFFGSMAWRFGRGFFFGLRYRPVRFHRETRRLYSIRSRRSPPSPEDGDILWEAPWTAESIFCLHKEITPFGTIFHIRHYTIDENGNVSRVFSIGREWTGSAEVELALAQWNYWCHYMNNGPEGLPKPMLFHTEHETLRESFLFSLYGLGLSAPVMWRIITMPLTLVFTVMRRFANATCRDPVWPESIEKISVLPANDPHAEPRPGTPVGWGETVLALQRGEYPDDPKARVKEWTGEPDGRLHARTWLADPHGSGKPGKRSPAHRSKTF